MEVVTGYGGVGDGCDNLGGPGGGSEDDMKSKRTKGHSGARVRHNFCFKKLPPELRRHEARRLHLLDWSSPDDPI